MMKSHPSVSASDKTHCSFSAITCCASSRSIKYNSQSSLYSTTISYDLTNPNPKHHQAQSIALADSVRPSSFLGSLSAYSSSS